MKFSLCSDMHIDHPQEKTPYDKFEKNIIVAGDTSNGLHGLRFLEKLRRKGFDVYATDGNHEHYSNVSKGRTAEETVRRFREEYSDRAMIDGVPVVLRNGWYPVIDHLTWFNYMNDGRNSGLTGDQVTMLAKADADYVESFLLGCKKEGTKAIVVTHTAPCTETLDPRYKGDMSNQWYWNPLMRPLLSEYRDHIHVWCHGHTHFRQEQIVDGVRVVCNPRGYPRENPDWEPWTIEINT